MESACACCWNVWNHACVLVSAVLLCRACPYRRCSCVCLKMGLHSQDGWLAPYAGCSANRLICINPPDRSSGETKEPASFCPAAIFRAAAATAQLPMVRGCKVLLRRRLSVSTAVFHGSVDAVALVALLGMIAVAANMMGSGCGGPRMRILPRLWIHSLELLCWS